MIRGGSTLGAGGAIPPNFGLAPQCDMKHCLTNSKASACRCKKKGSAAFKVSENAFPAGAHDASQPPSRLGRG